ncbi:DgyrCDS1186 [Dimorphilus gyrociliatus]|uniref:Twinfilin n=1 Tax=Dimorphilus gyrociliatus TaxID=2664684 RepID=A0A7I8V6N5_9ANNE|nr:DgyrCDS1186 [Dimorphilus gyrociliatus]
MSHQTGIIASDSLRSFFAQSKDGRIRLIKVSINSEREQLELEHNEPASGTWDEDYDKYILPLLEDKQPCYILYRMDTRDNDTYTWLFIAYSPDNSPVRQKMLYAATRATVKKEFGASQIKDELFGTHTEDVCLQGYKRHTISQDAAPPLTAAEEELAEIKKTEVQANVHVDSKHQTLAGVAFPISQSAFTALDKLKHKEITYVQLSLDIKRETIELEHSETIDIDEIRSRTPSDSPRYHILLFKHTHEGDYLEQFVFIYSMPGYKCSIKERMLYSSCKAPFIDNIEESLGMEIIKKIEVDAAEEITKDFIYDEVHPKKNIVKQKFAKPKGPAGRAPRNIKKE